MDVRIIAISGDRISDWETFHNVFKDAFGFPDFYGRNMDAWSDCMGDLDEPGTGMSTVSVAKGGLVVIRFDEVKSFQKRCPEQYSALIECASFVNYSRFVRQKAPILAILPVGD